MESLEHIAATLMTLPTEVAALRSEFHAFRSEARAFHDEMRLFQQVVASNFTRLENAMRGGDEETRRLLHEGDKETRSLMLALHEQVMARLDSLSGGDRIP